MANASYSALYSKAYILFFTLINRFFLQKKSITNRPIIILYANIGLLDFEWKIEI